MLLIHYNLYTIICNILLTSYVRHQPRKNTIKLWQKFLKNMQKGFLFLIQFKKSRYISIRGFSQAEGKAHKNIETLLYLLKGWARKEF